MYLIDFGVSYKLSHDSLSTFSCSHRISSEVSAGKSTGFFTSRKTTISSIVNTSLKKKYQYFLGPGRMP
jgi:hypothetical protein